MSIISERSFFSPSELESFLSRVAQGFGDGLTLYVTPGLPFGGDQSIPQEIRGVLSYIPNITGVAQTGACVLWGKKSRYIVIPPFPILKNESFTGLRVSPLLNLVRNQYLVAVVLLRLGRYSLGVFRGQTLLDSKTDTRYVKGRHRAGGSSANRFRRIRENQIQQLFSKVCGIAQDVIKPYENELDYLFFGGEHHVLRAFRKTCPYLEKFADRTMDRLLLVHRPLRSELDRMPTQIRSSQVLVLMD